MLIDMQYIPELTEKEIKENHNHFSERLSVYKKRDFDFLSSRDFILEKAEQLQGSILELGSGRGYTTLSLARAGYRFTSIDSDQEALRTTALNLAYENLLSSVKLYIMDAKHLAFADSSFSNIVVVNLFHHIEAIDKILSAIDRVLAINGKLILADFNEKGMEIINSVHKQEGRIHVDCGVNQDYVYSYFHSLGYEIRSYADRYHWLLIGQKRVQQ